jgi:2-haloacid dehalogenase
VRAAIVFDVNETLLDLAPVRRWFGERFGGQPDATMWFAELLRLSFVSSAIDRYAPFPELAGAALDTVAHRSGVSSGADDRTKIGQMFTTLPAHAEVAGGIGRLRKAGFTVAALTNSPQATADRQLDSAGIAGLFDAIMSVDMVSRFKPHRAVYQAGAKHLGVQPAELVMVAAHDWDVAGAMAAGCDGVFISRPGQRYSSSFATPTLVAPDVDQAASAIIERYSAL